MRKVNFNIDRIARLAFVHANATFADLVLAGDDLGFDGVLIPGGDADVRIGSLDAQIGSATNIVGFRPFLSARRQNRYGKRKRRKGSTDDSRFHGSPPAGKHTFARPVRRGYGESVRLVPSMRFSVESGRM